MASHYLQKYPVPEGFNDILHDLIKVVLKEQPADIHQFAFDYFNKQLP